MTHFLLLDFRTAQERHDELHENRQDLSCRSRSVLDQCFPNVDRSLSHDSNRVLSDNVECCQNTIPSVLAESVEQCLSGRVGGLGRSVFFLQFDLAADTSDFVQQLSGERNRRLSDSPGRVDHSLFEFGEQQVDRLGRIVCDDHLARTHGCLSDIL